MNNTILGKDELSFYDFIKLKNMILDIFKLFKYLERKDDKIAVPKITSDNRVRYNQFIPVKSSKVENCAIKNLMLDTTLEHQRIKLFSKITIALRKLNSIELQVFKFAFYEEKNDEEIGALINYCDEKVRKIKKSACIKFLSALGLDDRCFK